MTEEKKKRLEANCNLHLSGSDPNNFHPTKSATSGSNSSGHLFKSLITSSLSIEFE